MPTPTTTFIASLSDGSIACRSSTKLTYTHAVEITRDGQQLAATWHSTLELARQEAGLSFRRRQGAVVIPVAAFPFHSREAIDARTASGKKS